MARKSVGLTPEEERQLVAEWQRTKDPRVLDPFVTRNMGLVHKYIRNFQNAIDLDDAAQEGAMALRHAAERFDPSKSRFTTFASWWIRSYVSRYACANMTPISLNHGAAGALLMREPTIRKKIEARGEVATDEAIGRELHIDVHNVRTIRAIKGGGLRLDATFGEDGDASYHSVIADEADGADDTLSDELQKERLRRAVATLPERWRDIAERRFGLGTHEVHTLSEIGDVLGLSRERVRQVEEKLLARLRTEMMKTTKEITEAVPLLTVTDVAARLGCTTNNVYRLIKQGRLATTRRGRSHLVAADAVDALKSGVVPAPRLTTERKERGVTDDLVRAANEAARLRREIAAAEAQVEAAKAKVTELQPKLADALDHLEKLVRESRNDKIAA